MIIESVEIENLFQHTRLHQKLEAGVTAITGPIGSGKSNLLRSVRGGLTGDFDTRDRGGKARIIRRGAKSDAFVKLTLRKVNGQTVVVHRVVSRPGQSYVSLDGEIIAQRREDDINSAISQTLNVTSKELDTYVFVRQYTVSDVFKARPADRARMIGALCGQQALAKIYDGLGGELSRLSGVLEERDVDSLVSLTADYTGRRDSHRSLKKQYEELTSTVLSRDEERKLRKIVESYNTVRRLKRAIVEIKAELVEARAALEDCDADIADKTKSREEVASLLRVKQELRQQYENDLKAYEDYLKAKENIDRLKDLLNQAEPRKPRKPKDKPERGELQRGIEQEQHNIRACDAVISLHADGASTCPTCGTAVDRLDMSLEEAKAARAEARRRLADLKAADQQWVDYDSAKRVYKQAIDTWTASQARTREAIEQTPKLTDVAKPEVTTADVDSIQEEVRELRERLDDLDEEIEDANESRHQAKITEASCLQRLKMKRSDLSTAKDELDVSKSDYNRATERLREHDENIVMFDQVSTEFNQSSMHLRQLVQKIREVRSKKRSVRSLRSFSTDLERARDVLRPANLPTRIASDRTVQMIEAVNRVLLELDIRFQLVSQNLDFHVVHEDGSTDPVSELSGGQTNLLGMAFWLSRLYTFNTRLNLLALDEPSFGAGAQDLVYVASLFRKLDKECEDNQWQILLVTHEQALAAAAGRTISFY